MSWQVIVRPRAEADLKKAIDWYEARRKGLGDALLEEVRAAVGFLKEHPDRPPLYYRGFRRIITRLFPYKLFYRLEDDRVIVFRILHASQDHPQWLGG